MRKPFDLILRETWRLFVANLVIFVPVVGVWFVTFGFYLFLGVTFVLTNFLKIKDLIAGFDGTTGFSEKLVLDWIGRSVVYIIGMLLVVVLFQTFIIVVNGAGLGLMYARAATKGKTTLGDYFEGIGAFSWRSLMIVSIRGGMVSLPFLAVLTVIATVLIVSGNDMKSAGGFLAAAMIVMILGMLGAAVLAGIISFLTWMWKPAVFIRDIGTMEGLRESLRFVRRRAGGMILILLLWIAFTSVVSMFSSMMLISISGPMQTGGADSFNPMAVFMPFGIQFFNFFVQTLASVFFVLLYYKYYADEWQTPEVPARPSPWPAAPVPPPVKPAIVADPQSLSGLRPEHIYQPASSGAVIETKQPETAHDHAPPEEETGEEPDQKHKPGLPDGFA